MMDMRRGCIIIAIHWVVVNLILMAWMVMNMRRDDVQRTLRMWHLVMMNMRRHLLMLIIALLIIILGKPGRRISINFIFWSLIILAL